VPPGPLIMSSPFFPLRTSTKTNTSSTKRKLNKGITPRGSATFYLHLFLLFYLSTWQAMTQTMCPPQLSQFLQSQWRCSYWAIQRSGTALTQCGCTLTLCAVSYQKKAQFIKQSSKKVLSNTQTITICTM
jgi:hypothetical protein